MKKLKNKVSSDMKQKYKEHINRNIIKLETMDVEQREKEAENIFKLAMDLAPPFVF